MRSELSEAVRLLVAGIPGLVAIYRHGTWGTAAERPDSDVDLAVLPPAPTRPPDLAALASHLAPVFGREVDLVDLSRAPTVLRALVISKGDCIFEGDPTGRRLFEIYALSSYARLNEERAGILSDILARGSVRA